MRIFATVTTLTLFIGHAAARPQMPPAPTIDTMAVSPDGKVVAISYGGPACGRLELISAKNGRGIGVALDCSPKVLRIAPTAQAFSPSGERIAALASGRVVVWDATKSGTELLSIDGYDSKSPLVASSYLSALAFADNGKSIVSITNDANLRRWDAFNGKLLSTLSLGNVQHLQAVALTGNGTVAVSAHENAMIHVWNTETSACVRSFQLPKGVQVRALALAKDGRRLVATVHNESVNVRRIFNAFRAEAELINKTIVFDVQSGERVMELRETFSDVQFSPSGKLLVTCDYSGPIRVWNIASGKTVHRFATDSYSQQILPSPDGVHLLGRMPHAVSSWNIHTGERVLGRSN